MFSWVSVVLMIFIQGGTSLSMNGLQSVSKEIRDSFKAGEEVVFGAHVDENFGKEVKITVLGATSLEPLIKTADVAPVSQQVMELASSPKQSHKSKLAKQTKINQVVKSSNQRVKGKKITCTIPRYRFDIFGPMDLVEEIALGYGIANIEPKLSPSTTIGQKNDVTIKTGLISKTAIGLGFLEAMNSSLTSKKTLYDMTKRDSSKIISVLDSKSQEHTILRDSLLPSLLENLSKNIHESYPQKLFETGVVFSKSQPINESINFAAVIAYKDTNYSEIKAIMQSILKTNFKIESQTKTSKNQELFVEGKHADILVDEKKIGEIGEIDNEILENFRIRTSVTGFEIKLSGLIFD